VTGRGIRSERRLAALPEASVLRLVGFVFSPTELNGLFVEVAAPFFPPRLTVLSVSHAFGVQRRYMKRKYVGALIACLAAPLTLIAVLSGNISRNLRISQGGLLIADVLVMIIIFAALLMSRKQEDHSS